MTMRVAMVNACPFPVPQGSQVYMRDTARSLQQRGHDVHLVVYGHGTGRGHGDLKVHRCRRIPGDARTQAGPALAKPLLDLALVSTLRRVVRQEQIEVVCAHNYEALLVALIAGKRPIIYHAHNAMGDELPHYFRFKKLPTLLGRWLDWNFPKRADHIVVPHRRLAGHLVVRGCDHEKISVVPPPLDANEFQPCVAGKETPPVLYAGNLDAYQNLGFLFAVMERVRKRMPEARLLIATAEDAELPGAELVPTPGFDSLHQILAEDSVFAIPRVAWSGYPIKLLNAMAAGKAIVACDSAAYALDHEENGLAVPDNDGEAFADALVRLLSDPKLRARLGKKARETIIAKHQPGDAGAKLEGIAERLLDQAKGGQYTCGNNQ